MQKPRKELRLKQLDTEQQALQTEMESVKKVIDKQIEQISILADMELPSFSEGIGE